MGLFAMISKSFAVVPDENEDRFLVQAVLRQPSRAPADLFIHKGDPAVIQAGGAARAVLAEIGLGRGIRNVGS